MLLAECYTQTGTDGLRISYEADKGSNSWIMTELILVQVVYLARINLNKMKTLADISPMQEVVIEDFENSSASIKRLLSLGLEPGAVVTCEYHTLFKGTICISNKNRMIALDRKEAEKIKVTPHQ